MQSDRNSSKTNTFHEPITYGPPVRTSSEQQQKLVLDTNTDE